MTERDWGAGMGKSWTDGLAGKAVFVLLLAFSLSDSWGTWWVVLPGAIALGWGVLLVRDAGKAVRGRRARGRDVPP
ncbi:hypothetical protein [Streptomyces sp. NPDC092952]|uniref:hypothetical protein n=1 Tax=Streptomyces sp. NPDC092952 TaxID=3366018 RepID=UPI003813AC9C